MGESVEEENQNEFELKEKIKTLKIAESELQESYNRWKERIKSFSHDFAIYHSSMNKSILLHGENYKHLVYAEEWLDKIQTQSIEKDQFIQKFYHILLEEKQ